MNENDKGTRMLRELMGPCKTVQGVVTTSYIPLVEYSSRLVRFFFSSF